MERLTRASLRHPVATLAMIAAISALAGAGLWQLTTDVGYRAFLGADHPTVRRLDEFLARFGGGLAMVAVWSCEQTERCDDVFDEPSLEMARDVVEALKASGVADRIESPATSRLMLATPFGPVSRRFVEDGEVAADARDLAGRAVVDPAWRNLLVSGDGLVGAIVVELASSDSASSMRAVAALEAALAPFEAGEDAFRFHRVGGPVEFVVAGEELERATLRLTPLMVLLVGGTLLVLFRSSVASALALLPVGVAVLWTMGLLGWLGWPQNSLTQTLPPLVLVIGVCDCIHILSRHATAERTAGDGSRAEREERLLETVRDVGPACLMTSLTTMAGLLSFATAELESFTRFGVAAAVGVAAALVLSFSLLPLTLLTVGPDRLRVREASESWRRPLAGLLRVPQRHGRAVLVAGLASGALCSFGMARLQVDASFEDLYGEHSPVVRWAKFVSEHLRRPETLEIDLELPDSVDVQDPRALATVARLERLLSESDELGPARSLLGPISWQHRLLRGDDAEFERPADTADENFALIAMASAFGAEAGEDGLAHWLSRDRRHIRISLESAKSPQVILRREMTRVREILDEELPPGWLGSATGPYAVIHDMIEAIRTTQLRSFLAAGLSVTALMAVFLRSIGRALLALVPAALPVVITLGSMGLLGVRLDVGSAMVAAVVLGVAVDDIIHLLEAFRRRRRSGEAVQPAMLGAVGHVGRALVTTSAALAVGFAALALSPWQTVANFGLVSAVAIGAALLCTLLMLPALVFALPERGRAAGVGP